MHYAVRDYTEDMPRKFSLHCMWRNSCKLKNDVFPLPDNIGATIRIENNYENQTDCWDNYFETVGFNGRQLSHSAGKRYVNSVMNFSKVVPILIRVYRKK